MYRQEAVECYAKALKSGQKEYRERTAAGLPPYPSVLDEQLTSTDSTQIVGLVEVPTDRIIGVKTAGRISAFSAGFYPLLQADTEFAAKWVELCAAHLANEGIRDPIVCYEYLGNFYVQEGNKRVSVLKYFGAPTVPGNVTRVMPQTKDEQRLKAYREFLEFYKVTKLYDIQFKEPGSYGKLLQAAGKAPGEEWSQAERRTLSASYHYFREAFFSVGGRDLRISPEEALLLWLQVYSYKELVSMSSAELKKSLSSMWREITARSEAIPVEVHTNAPAKEKTNIITKLISAQPEHLDVAFVHTKNKDNSEWVLAHEQGRDEMQAALGDKVTCRSYFDADTPEKAEALLARAVADGADVIFTTAVQLTEPSLRLAVKYPKLRVYNCSLNMPYPSIRTYYSRLYEGKFITGAIAGAMAKDGRIGYVSSYPILGELASINAFALGAQLTNPRARVRLEWSCLPGNCVDALLRAGVQVISNRDTPVADKFRPIYGTYYRDEGNNLIPLASPCCMWGSFYTKIIEAIFSGQESKAPARAVSYWWGMESGAINVTLTDNLPEGVRQLSEILRQGLLAGTIDPFFRPIQAQDGTVKNDGTHSFTPDEILNMDYLVRGIEGHIPCYGELLPMARHTVQLLGVYRDKIPSEETPQ